MLLQVTSLDGEKRLVNFNKVDTITETKDGHAKLHYIADCYSSILKESYAEIFTLIRNAN